MGAFLAREHIICGLFSKSLVANHSALLSIKFSTSARYLAQKKTPGKSSLEGVCSKVPTGGSFPHWSSKPIIRSWSLFHCLVRWESRIRTQHICQYFCNI